MLEREGKGKGGERKGRIGDKGEEKAMGRGKGMKEEGVCTGYEKNRGTNKRRENGSKDGRRRQEREERVKYDNVGCKRYGEGSL